jgi:hypothetical protein
MPSSCFSYPADVSVGTPNRGAPPATPRDPRGMGYPCFSYPQMCFGYSGDVPPALRQMPAICFRY